MLDIKFFNIVRNLINANKVYRRKKKKKIGRMYVLMRILNIEYLCKDVI